MPRANNKNKGSANLGWILASEKLCRGEPRGSLPSQISTSAPSYAYGYLARSQYFRSVDMLVTLPDHLQTNLLPSERFCLEQVLAGREANFFTHFSSGKTSQTLAYPTEATEYNLLRPEFLEWLLTDRKLITRITPRGIFLRGTYISGDLNLEGAQVPHRLFMRQCYIDGTLNLSEATCRTIHLVGLYVESVQGEYLKIRGSFELKRSVCPGGVNILGAQVSGNFIASGAKLGNGQGYALLLSRARIKGAVFLDQGFEAKGDIRLVGTWVGLSISLITAKLYNQSSVAILADTLQVRGSIILDRAEIAGEVRLGGAYIGRQLIARGTRIESLTGVALRAYKMRVAADAGLSEGFYAKGGIRISGSTIGGELSLVGSRLENPNGDALYAPLIEVDGHLELSNGFEAMGRVVLDESVIRGQLRCNGGGFYNVGQVALQAYAVQVGGDVLFEEGFTAVGQVHLRGSTIRGQMLFSNASLYHPKNRALEAGDITIRRNLVLGKGFYVEGTVNLRAAVIRGNLEIRHAHMHAPQAQALRAEYIRVNGRLIMRGSTFTGFLNLQHSRVGLIYDDEMSWPERGYLQINGLEYEGFEGELVPLTARTRLDWIRRMLPEFRPQPYEQLAKVFVHLGMDNEATDILIAKEDDRLRYAGPRPLQRIGRYILRYTIAYGYRPWLALIWALGFLVGGAFIFQAAYLSGLMVPASAEVLVSEAYTRERILPPDYPPFEGWAYALDTFLPLVSLFLEEYWLPDGTKPLGAAVRFYLWVHITAGWLLSSLFAGGLLGLVRQKSTS